MFKIKDNVAGLILRVEEMGVCEKIFRRGDDCIYEKKKWVFCFVFLAAALTLQTNIPHLKILKILIQNYIQDEMLVFTTTCSKSTFGIKNLFKLKTRGTKIYQKSGRFIKSL